MTEETRRPVDTPRIIANHAGQPCYLVEYDEDLWNRYDKPGQDGCFETWARKAKPLGAQFVVLKLFPDPLFPMGDRTIPYVSRSYAVDQETFNPVTVTAKLTAMIDADTWEKASEMKRGDLKIAARAAVGMHALACTGCSYEILTRFGKEVRVLERSRL